MWINENPANLIAVLSVGISLASFGATLFFSNRQIKLSNKHQLFDRRFKIYTVLDDLIASYLEFKNNKREPLLGNKPSEIFHFDFIKLTTVRELKSISEALIAFDQPMNNTLMLEKLEYYDSYRRESSIVFKSKLANQISSFIECYINVLVSLAFYQNHLGGCCQNSYEIREQTGVLGNFSDEDKDNEKLLRDKVYLAYNNLDNAYKVITEERTVDSVKKTLKLW